MTVSRSARVWGLVAAEAASRGREMSAADACVAAVEAVEVTGAWLSAADGAEMGHLLRVTDEVSEQLAELQLTLGEGPCSDAAAVGGPVLSSDLGDAEAVGCWPVFAPAARQAGAAAVFAFPLRIGAIRAGVMGMYRDRPGSLSDFQLGDALAFADTATMLMLDSADQAEVDQATGMVTEQLGVGIAEAFVRLRAHAYAYDRRLGDLARDIVARRVRLSPDLDVPEDFPV